MRFRTLALASVGLALAFAGCGGGDAEDAVEAATEAAGTLTEAAGSVTEEAGSVAEDVAGGIEVTLNEQNGSGQSGTATLSAGDDGTLRVSVSLSGGGADPQPAHIHEGTCADLNPEPAFPLESVVEGQSESDVDVSLEDLALTPYAINVHKSEAEADVYVACGDIADIAP
jgi:hypothetical protein